MAEGGFDPCECVFSHENAMRRLIALLRNSQSYCSTELCLQDLPGPVAATQETGTDSTFMMVMMGWTLMALVMFFLRPTSLLNRGGRKPRNQGHDQPPPDSSVQ